MFCKYCGTQVPDGEVCNCAEAVANRANNPAPQPEAAKENEFVAKLSAAAKDIPNTTKQLLGNASGSFMNAASAGIFAVIGLVLHILTWLCMAEGMLGDIADWYEDLYLNAVWGGCLSWAIPFAFGMILVILGQLLRKEDIQAGPAFVEATGVLVIPSVLFMLAGLMYLLSEDIGGIFLLITLFAALAGCIKLIGKHIGSKESAGNLVVTAVILAILAWILIELEMEVAPETFSTAIGNLLN